jgi:pantetheine-phosphate adenylyltransferase
MKAIYPGSFDPLTLGHLDIIKRAAKVFDSLDILVSDNPNKQGVLSNDERVHLIKEAVEAIPNVNVKTFTGLTVDYAKKHGFPVILRGIRAASDFEAELEMSQVNNFLSDLETIFLMTSPEYSFIRASRVWELLRLGGDISSLVPRNVADYLRDYLQNNQDNGYLQQTR